MEPLDITIPIPAGRDPRYVVDPNQVKSIRRSLKVGEIVPTFGCHNTVAYSMLNNGYSIPFNGASARAIYDIALSMGIIDNHFLAVAAVKPIEA